MMSSGMLKGLYALDEKRDPNPREEIDRSHDLIPEWQELRFLGGSFGSAQALRSALVISHIPEDLLSCRFDGSLRRFS